MISPNSQRIYRLSLSARRAWIEISDLKGNFITNELSLSARRAWIEISQVRPIMVTSRSLSARRAWIEIVTVSLYSSCAFGRSPQGERG